MVDIMFDRSASPVASGIALAPQSLEELDSDRSAKVPLPRSGGSPTNRLRRGGSRHRLQSQLVEFRGVDRLIRIPRILVPDFGVILHS